MRLGQTWIEDAVGEAFSLPAARLIVTAEDEAWVDAAVGAACGYGTSIIGCDAEAGRAGALTPERTPDGRPGAGLLFFARTAESLARAVQRRTGQGLMTCPTTAVFDGRGEAADRFPLGRWLRYFGDGHQHTQTRHGRHGHVIPVMEGEFFAEATAGWKAGVAGGTIYVGGPDRTGTLAAARGAAEAIAGLEHIITPFPGGVCRCGSKAGSRYRQLTASTRERYCPTLRDRVRTALPAEVECVYEVVINGLNEAAVRQAMRAGIQAAAGAGAGWISTGEFGGRLGTIRLPLREMVGTAGP